MKNLSKTQKLVVLLVFVLVLLILLPLLSMVCNNRKSSNNRRFGLSVSDLYENMVLLKNGGETDYMGFVAKQGDSSMSIYFAPYGGNSLKLSFPDGISFTPDGYISAGFFGLYKNRITQKEMLLPYKFPQDSQDTDDINISDNIRAYVKGANACTFLGINVCSMKGWYLGLYFKNDEIAPLKMIADY